MNFLKSLSWWQLLIFAILFLAVIRFLYTALATSMAKSLIETNGVETTTDSGQKMIIVKKQATT